jgi:hypothetical protein
LGLRDERLSLDAPDVVEESFQSTGLVPVLPDDAVHPHLDDLDHCETTIPSKANEVLLHGDGMPLELHILIVRVVDHEGLLSRIVTRVQVSPHEIELLLQQAILIDKLLHHFL